MASQRLAAPEAIPPTHPGELFKRSVLPALDLTVSEAASQLRVSRQTLHRLMAGTHAVTPEMALRLGRFCGSGPYLWLRMQQNYDLWNVEHDARAELERIPPAFVSESPGVDEAPDVFATLAAAGEELNRKIEPSDDELGELYDEIATLTETLGEHDHNDFLARSLTEAQIDAAYVELRRLQTEEVKHFRRAFEESLELPLGEGSRVLREARALRGELEQILESGKSVERSVMENRGLRTTSTAATAELLPEAKEREAPAAATSSSDDEGALAEVEAEAEAGEFAY